MCDSRYGFEPFGGEGGKRVAFLGFVPYPPFILNRPRDVYHGAEAGCRIGDREQLSIVDAQF
ncbi:MAG: hypothetical protein DRH32_06720 [Deltaproteobacteria bacterium]|nr:MAG: hypothetical protein DRH32_06720 [Deltaproteobacteria bacterium]